MKIAQLIADTALYHPARDAYLRFFKRGYWKQHVYGPREFFRQFVKPGALVFDIGANVGIYTQFFADLGARVVAVEPNPTLLREIFRVRPHEKVSVVPAAAGAATGIATFHMSEISVLGTMSADWIATAQQSKRFADVRWDRRMDVAVTTVDRLIETHGLPDFIKIDVEGFEGAVLDGLTTPPKALSFEFNSEVIDKAVECLAKPVMKNAKVNYHIAEDYSLELAEWTTPDELAKILPATVHGREIYGDVIAKWEQSENNGKSPG